MLIRALLCLALLCVRCQANTLTQGEIIPRFYTLLSQESKPSELEEKAFFGGNDCSDIRTMLASGSDKSASTTPIWDYLRSHRTLFIPEDSVNRTQPLVAVSSPFTMSPFKNTAKATAAKVLVTFPTKRTSASGYSGNSAVLFSLGEEASYLNIGATLILGNGKLLLEQVISDLGIHP